MRRLISLIVFLLPCIVRADDVEAFLTAYSAALSSAPAISADIVCEELRDDVSLRGRISGLVTFHAGRDRFLRMTLTRSWNDPARRDSMIIAACRDDAMTLVDTGLGARFETRLSHEGAHLLTSTVSSDLLLLMFPEMLTGLGSGRVTDELWLGRATKRLRVEQDGRTFVLRVDADTFLPLQIVRTTDSWRGSETATLTLTGHQLAKGPPPPELFRVATGAALPLRTYDPGNLRALEKAPDFQIRLADQSLFRLSDHRGKNVVLYFCADWSGSSAELQPRMRRFARKVQQSGGLFLQLEIWNLKPLPREADNEAFPRLEADAVGTLYNMESVGVPCVVVVNPEGRIIEVLAGYVPGNTEAALTDLAKRLQAAAATQ